MTTKRSVSAGTASVGVHHVAKVASACNCVFQEIDQQNDLGNDAYIEFVIDEASTGCCIAAQIKSGSSYIRNGKYVIPVDEKHFEYWDSHTLPICGLVYDPKTDIARWVDITSYLINAGTTPHAFSIEIPETNIFDKQHFQAFRDHFLAYRVRFSDSAHFGRSLAEFSRLDDLPRCANAIRSLFSFHRNRIETWYFLLSCLPNFRDHPLLRLLVATLTHVPGHADIFWGSRNIVSEPVRKEAEWILRRFLSRDSVLTLLCAIDPENGIGRGSIGQCVHAIVALIPSRPKILESIVFDQTVPEDLRYWSLILLVESEQCKHLDFATATVERALSDFSDDDNRDRLQYLREMLKTHQFVDFW